MSALFDTSLLRPLLLARPGQSLLRESSHKTAAVAAIVRNGTEGVEVLLIRRAEREGDPWSGQMALPGGRHDPTDDDLLHTARRETSEEVGLHLPESSLVVALDDLEAVARGRRTGLIIRPFVFVLDGERPELHPNEEVAETLWTPLAPLHAGERDTVRPYRMAGQLWKLPGWDVDGRIVWGLTHRILSNLLERV